MQKMLMITKIEDAKVASDGRSFKQIWFLPKSFTPAGAEILSNDSERSRNIWNQGPPSAKGKKDFSKGDPLFENARVGSLVDGSIHTRTVVPYEIGDNLVSTATIVAFAGEQANLAQAFKRQGYELVDPTTGEILTGRAQVTAQVAQENLVDADA